jgi:hypothetical protein
MKNFPSPSKIHIIAVSAGALLVGIFLWSTLDTFAFIGPTANPPTGNGAVSSDASNNVYVGGNLNVSGTITSANNFSGFVSAANISQGTFGSSTGGGNYTFSSDIFSQGINVGTSSNPAGTLIYVATSSAIFQITTTSTQILNNSLVDASGNKYSTSTGAIGANPSGSVGTTPVNGSATTFMRSDAAPTISSTATFSFSALGNTTSTGNISAVSMTITSAVQSASIGGAALVIGKCNTAAVTIAGATTTRGAVFVSPVTYPGSGVLWDGYVSAVNTVTVQECVETSTAPTASVFNVVYVY